ncbi:anti-CBASS protein Acb1 family protein [Haloferax volcanii]|uniref:anti-CBASS protein Acb1 family protein n=1 Tax=Haloferax volcanii TaxID=2246 RepID=UPI00249A89CE|nr:anti-CBASS Acb1 family protein [Haloferax alexandrinus]WEL29863.1 DUF1073 domain-containing protein [Haloferax alexandrinus]
MTEQSDGQGVQSDSAGATDDVEEATGEATAGDQSLELTAAEQFDRTMRQTLAAVLGQNIPGGDDGAFSYYEVFDWDKNPGVDQFYALALRNPYAFAVTFLPPKTTWRDGPEIVDDGEAADGQTAFESKVKEIVREQKLWHYAKRADKLAGIGQYGVLVLQFDDIGQGDVGNGGKKDGFGSPVTSATTLKGLRPFSEKSVDQIETGGPTSTRWGKPIRYKLDLSDEDDSEGDETEIDGNEPDSMWVHHTRVIHIPSDELLDDEIRGVPRQQPVYNNLIDIERALGSAGQLAYRAAAWGININIDKDFDIDDGGDKLKEHLHRWEVGLENILRTHGASDVQSLGGEEIDPSNITDPNIEALSAQAGIPQSVLKGNETGERATTQDLKEWYGKIAERREEFVGPIIVRELIERLRTVGILPDPQGDGYDVDWPPLEEPSESDIAEMQGTRAETLERQVDLGFTRQQRVEYVRDGTIPTEVQAVAGDVAELEDAEAQASAARSVDEITTEYEAVADGGVSEDE